jgi:hypothetical protein
LPGVYTVSVTGLTDDADLHVFTEVFTNNGSVISPAVCSPLDNTLLIGNAPEDCTLQVNTSNTDVLFVVDGIFSTAFTVQYTALVTPAPNVPNPAPEGSFQAPVGMTVDTTPKTGQVARAGTSFYAASGLTPGSRYTISITGLTDAADLTAFGDSTFTTRLGCLIDNARFAGTAPESCTLQAPQGGTVFFTVTSGSLTGNGAAYMILVEPGP